MKLPRKVWTGEEFEQHVKAALNLAVEGLTTDGAHHKQLYLGKIVEELGLDPKAAVEGAGFDYEEGIAP